MPNKETGAPAAYSNRRTWGNTPRSGTCAAPINSQFSATSAKSAAIERTHLHAILLCSGPGRSRVKELSDPLPASAIAISATFFVALGLTDMAGFLALSRKPGVPPGINRAQSTTSDFFCPEFRRGEDT